jgi:hypothetical protein
MKKGSELERNALPSLPRLAGGGWNQPEGLPLGS